LTLEDISKATDISISTIKDIFRGATYAPRIDTVQAIEKALGLSAASEPQWTAEDYANGVTDAKKISITADEEDMLILFREIGEKYGVSGQEKLKQIAEVFLQTEDKKE
jgi:transcriptional regulator with XRE-family HTH domain